MSASELLEQGVDESVATLAQPGKYLTFALGEEVFGLEILSVQEIIGMMPVTRMPRTPEFVRGVINLRGKVIPVVDLRLKFGLEGKEDTELTCIIVVKIGSSDDAVTVGLIVDAVSEVVDVGGEQIEPPPALGASIETHFIRGMGKIGGKVVMLLEVGRVLNGGMLTAVAEAAIES